MPDLDNYIEFFEVEPELTTDRSWHSGVRFSTRRGDDLVVATLAPDEAEFSFEWERSGSRLLRFNLVMVTSWEIDATNGKEMLILKSSTERPVLCIVHMRPEIRVEWHMAWG